MIDDIMDILDMADMTSAAADAVESAISVSDLVDMSELPEMLDDNSVLGMSDVIEHSDSYHHLAPEDGSYNVPFEGEKSNKEWYEYYEGKEKHALEQENSHLESAKKALANGDERAYKDHMSRAKSWHSDAQGFKRSADIYKNK